MARENFSSLIISMLKCQRKRGDRDANLALEQKAKIVEYVS